MSIVKNYAQYHDTKKRGDVVPLVYPYEIDTRRIPKDIIGHNAWLIRGEKQGKMSYYLHYCFIVEGIDPQRPNVIYASGGHTFDQSVLLNELPWFERYEKTQFFSRGLHRVPDFVAAEL